MSKGNEPWLLAVWPGMGNVALLAGAYLVETLQPDELVVFDPGSHFDISSVNVRQGVLEIPSFPRSTLYGWQNPDGRDLLIMVGEDQPAQGGYEFCGKILDAAMRFGCQRVVTFAASLAKLGPDDPPGLMGAVNQSRLVRVLEENDIPLMSRGHITGLNGVFLGAAAVRNLEGLCLLGEIPFYAIPLPNPATSFVLLRAFCMLAGIDLPLDDLEEKARTARSTIEALYRSYEQAAAASGELDDDDDDEDEDEGFSIADLYEHADDDDDDDGGGPPAHALARIEQLFQEAADDRTKALELKQELDRWDLFKEYEDRFLDLFKKDSSS